MNLLSAELWRFRSRRIVLWSVIVAVAITTIGMTIAFVNSTYDPASRFESYTEDCFRTAPTNAEGEPEFADCPMEVHYSQDNRVRLDELEGLLGGVGQLFVLLALLLGASSLGAEFGAASLSSQLLFEPRRVRVWITKAVAVAIGVAIVAVIIVVVLVGEFVGVAAVRGITTGSNGEFWVDRGLDMGRLVVASAIGGLFGFTITGFTRRTVGAVVAFIVLVIGEVLVYNATDLLDGRLPISPLFLFVADPFGDFEFNPADAFGIGSLAEAIAVPLVWVAALLAIGAVQFRRTEIR